MTIRAASFFLLVYTAGAQKPVGAQLDAIFAPLAGAKSPGLAVLVRKDGRSVFERGYGALYAENVTQADKGCDFGFLARPGRNPDPDPR